MKMALDDLCIDFHQENGRNVEKALYIGLKQRKKYPRLAKLRARFDWIFSYDR